jgi:hypothetical protein
MKTPPVGTSSKNIVRYSLDSSLNEWTQSTCDGYLDAIGLGDDLWSGFYERATSCGDADVIARVESMLLDCWHERIFLDRFKNRDDVYFRQLLTSQKDFQYVAVKECDDNYRPFDVSLLRDHFAGNITLSVPAVSVEKSCKWVCWDNDCDDGVLNEIEQSLSQIGLNGLRESKREGRDGHLWAFFDDTIDVGVAIRLNEIVTESSGIGNRKQLEFFPKSERGLQVRLPLGVHRKPEANNEIGWFEDAPRSLNGQLSWFAQQPLNSAEGVTRIANLLPKAAPIAPPRLQFAPSQDHEKIDLLAVLPAAGSRTRGGKIIRQCPVCADEGHDKSEDNLHIDSSDGALFCCWFGGQPGKLHTTEMILRAYGLWRLG